MAFVDQDAPIVLNRVLIGCIPASTHEDDTVPKAQAVVHPTLQRCLFEVTHLPVGDDVSGLHPYRIKERAAPRPGVIAYWRLRMGRQLTRGRRTACDVLRRYLTPLAELKGPHQEGVERVGLLDARYTQGRLKPGYCSTKCRVAAWRARQSGK